MEGLLWFLAFGALFYLMMRFGCGGHGGHGHGRHEEYIDKESKEGGSIDPVCGMKVPADQGYTLKYQGKAYRFYSRTCLDKFETDPGRYPHVGGQGGGS